VGPKTTGNLDEPKQQIHVGTWEKKKYAEINS